MRGTDDLYRRLIELSPDGILLSKNNRIVFLNPAAVRLLGATAPEQLAGQIAVRYFCDWRATRS